MVYRQRVGVTASDETAVSRQDTTTGKAYVIPAVWPVYHCAVAVPLTVCVVLDGDFVSW